MYLRLCLVHSSFATGWAQITDCFKFNFAEINNGSGLFYFMSDILNGLSVVSAFPKEVNMAVYSSQLNQDDDSTWQTAQAAIFFNIM